MAGEIVALGQSVTGWKVGDRVSANFAPYHLYGEATPVTIVSHFGGPQQGVLTEYRAFPVDVRAPLLMNTVGKFKKSLTIIVPRGHPKAPFL